MPHGRATWSPTWDFHFLIYKKIEMLTSALRALVKNPIKESFYGEKKI